MLSVSYYDFKTEEGKEAYRQKALINIDIFAKIFGVHQALLKNPAFKTGGENEGLLRRISELSGVPRDVVDGINCSDEALNMGCTSIGRNGVIGQTLDLFTVELCLVREGGALYITMPPYLTLMGMNVNLAFCTNYLSGSVQGGVPVSHLRRNLLRQSSLDDAINYLDCTAKTTPVNFLLTDGETVLDVESLPAGIRVYAAQKDERGTFNAHTNHIIYPNIMEDHECPRLQQAVRLLENGVPLEEIFEDKTINVPVNPLNNGIGFGSIVKVVMDVKNHQLKYKDPSMTEYKTVQL